MRDLIIVLVLIGFVIFLHYLLFTKMAERAIDKKKSTSSVEPED